MKCPKCDGRGKTTEYDGLRKFWCDYKCEVCNGTGEVEMTNEEWIKSLDTEQLADVFYMVFHNHADRVLNAFWDKHKEVFKKNAMEWLKQPHKDTK